MDKIFIAAVTGGIAKLFRDKKKNNSGISENVDCPQINFSRVHMIYILLPQRDFRCLFSKY